METRTTIDRLFEDDVARQLDRLDDEWCLVFANGSDTMNVSRYRKGGFYGRS